MTSSSSSSSSIQRSLNRSQQDLSKSFEKLSSGKRINKASDDAAGLAIASALESDAVVYKQANRNIDDAQSVIDVTDSAVAQVSDVTTRMAELATQSANGTLSDTQRESLNNEYQALAQEVSRIGSTTQFNGRSLLDGSSTVVQAGKDGSSDSQIATPGVDLNALVGGAIAGSIATADQARSAIDQLKSTSDSLSSARGDLGAASSRYAIASNNNSSSQINSLTAESRIRDADVATETANNIAAQVKSDASAALAAQSNVTTKKVYDLLK